MWWYSNQSLHWMMEGVSFLLHGCHSPVDGDISSPVFRVESLRVRFTKDPLPSCALSLGRWALKQVGPMWSKWTKVHRDCICGSVQSQSKFVSLSPLCLSQTTAWHCSSRNEDGFASSWDLAFLCLELPQDLFTLDLAPKCGISWVELECSCLERDLWVLLPRCWTLGPTPDVHIHDVDLPHY